MIRFKYYISDGNATLYFLLRKVTIGGLADKAGLRAGDVIIKLNGEPMHQLTHADAHNRIINAGNDFELTVARDRIIRNVPQQ